MIINNSPQVNSSSTVSVTVSLASAESPELILIIAGERRYLPLSKQSRLFEKVRDLVLDASDEWERE